MQGWSGALGQAVEAGAGVVEVGLAGESEPVGESVEVQGDLAGIGDADLAGLAGGQGAAVGGQVGEGHVDLVADRRDDRDARGGDGPRHDLLVEGPEVFEAAAAAGDDDDVGAGDPVGQRQGRDDLAVGALALDPGRRDEDLGASPAAADDLEEVADGGAGRAGHDHDPAGEPGQRPLSARVEQPLGGQPREPLAERQLERPRCPRARSAGP